MWSSEVMISTPCSLHTAEQYMYSLLYGPYIYRQPTLGIHIPQTAIMLSDEQLRLIMEQFDPLHPSDSYGVDLYIALRYVVVALQT